MKTNLSMDCLRSFVAVVEQGSFLQAASQVGRTASAVSQQMERLQSQTGLVLFKKDGRNRVVTSAGVDFIEFARAILAQNDAALKLAETNQISGVVKLGIIQDFAEDFFPKALAEFAEHFHNIRIEVLVERSGVLLDLLEKGQLDQVIAYKHQSSAVSTKLHSTQMLWLGQKGASLAEMNPLPLILVEGPCVFRQEALKALGEVGLPWEIKLSSPSLACVAAAAEAGLGVAVRTTELLERRSENLVRLPELPALPKIELHLYNHAEVTNSAINRLTDFWIDRIARLKRLH